MKSWGFDFGYELIDDGWKLAYPPPDPRLAELMRQVVATARVNQARLAAACAANTAADRRPCIMGRQTEALAARAVLRTMMIEATVRPTRPGRWDRIWEAGAGDRGPGTGVRGRAVDKAEREQQRPIRTLLQRVERAATAAAAADILSRRRHWHRRRQHRQRFWRRRHSGTGGPGRRRGRWCIRRR